MISKNCLLALLICLGHTSFSQTNIAEVKNKICLLKGDWQLIQTFSDSALHKVEKEEYDAVMRFRPFHRYNEEVHYEGYHWKIEGRWFVFRHRATLLLLKRHYVLGTLTDVPQDIHFELAELTNLNFTGNTTAEDNPVKFFYKKVKKKKR
jgi:hypothetical protein